MPRPAVRRRPRRRRPPVAPVPFRIPRAMWPRIEPMFAYEAALQRAGFEHVAGADEAGRGACAGPLVVAACVLPAGARGRIADLDDSKVLTAATRERLFDVIVKRAVSYRVIIVPAAEIDAWGLHVANLAGMRRAISGLDVGVHYALTDGFAVPGLAAPSTAVWKGDATVGCIAAASILAKVTRDRIMIEMADEFPNYEFARHKGYVTPEHTAALLTHGPCAQHRRRYVNVRRAADHAFGDSQTASAQDLVDISAGLEVEVGAGLDRDGIGSDRGDFGWDEDGGDAVDDGAVVDDDLVAAFEMEDDEDGLAATG